ncbi:hypothetical protein RvY_16781 [Ramazzottius varieornatus]|uniref:Uncharacterized protein n=1 Tax=Ramazzottius varieornatus TaxID=947166 RepID=A0A1D1W0T8_RAMVA|nr:hypothetical protein RvY_16781 [Ramazzottius varieornatus]
MDNMDQNASRLLRGLRQMAIWRTFLLCPILGLAVYCSLDRIQCEGFKHYIISRNTMYLTTAIPSLALLLLLIVFAVFYKLRKRITDLLNMESHRCFNAPSSLLTFSWLSMESISFCFFAFYGGLQMNFSFTDFRDDLVSDHPVLDEAPTNITCLSLNKTQMEPVPYKIMVICEVTEGLFLLFSFVGMIWFIKSLRAARRLRMFDAQRRSDQARLEAVCEADVALSRDYGRLHGQDDLPQYDVAQERGPLVTTIPILDAPPSYESVTKSDAERQAAAAAGKNDTADV